jgi:hypothetical protein
MAHVALREQVKHFLKQSPDLRQEFERFFTGPFDANELPPSDANELPSLPPSNIAQS